MDNIKLNIKYKNRRKIMNYSGLDWENGSNFHTLKKKDLWKNWDNVLKDIRGMILSADIIEKFSNHLEDEDIHIFYRKEFMRNVKMSESYMRKNKELLNWDMITQLQTLSESFIEEMEDCVDWLYIFNFQDISFSFLKKHIVKLSKDEIKKVDFAQFKFTQNQLEELNRKIKFKYMFEK
jgi:hypothetical protein